MTNRDSEPEDVQRALATQQREQILDAIVSNYTSPTDSSRESAQNIAHLYARAQRDYWDNNPEADEADVLRQVWTDALVQAATENDWNTLKQAIGFDIVDFSDRPTVVSQQRVIALLNLTKFL